MTAVICYYCNLIIGFIDKVGDPFFGIKVYTFLHVTTRKYLRACQPLYDVLSSIFFTENTYSVTMNKISYTTTSSYF